MIKDAFKAQLNFVAYSVQQNLEGVTHEDSLKSAGEGGNCINWVLGHILNTRGLMLRLIGGEPKSCEGLEELYGRFTKPIGAGDDCASLDALLEAMAASQEAMLERLATVDDAGLEAMVPQLFDAEKQEPAGVQFATLLFHESYHAGQLGVIRRNVGLAAAIS